MPVSLPANVAIALELRRQQQSDTTRQPYRVVRSQININVLDRVEETLKVRPPGQERRITHSADIKRSYTPLWEKYKRSLILPPEMTDEERDAVRRLRQDPFAKRYTQRVLNNGNVTKGALVGVQWKLSPRVEHEKNQHVETPRSSATPRFLKTLHKGITVQPVGKMSEDISFRTPVAPSSAASSPRRDTGCELPQFGMTPRMPRGRLPSSAGVRHLSINAPGAYVRTKRQAAPRMDSSRNTDREDPRYNAMEDLRYKAMEDAELQRCVATFNELKRKAFLMDRVPVSIEVLTPEMFVRVEDDFLRATHGRKTRILMSSDFDDEIRLGGNVFTRRRLEFLLAKDKGSSVSFVQLFQYAFPFVSSAQIDHFMLQYSTSMNVLLGGPLQTRTEPAVYRSIERLYLQFDLDGDGVVYIQDVVRQQRKLYESSVGHGQGGSEQSGVEFESANHHIQADPDGRVTIESFARFARFLFPPYKPLETDDV